MNGLRIDSDLPEGVRLEPAADGALLVVPEKGMYELLIPIGVRARGTRLRVEAGAGSRVRLVLDYEFEASLEAEFALDAGAYMDVFHLDYQQRDTKLVSRNAYALKKHASLNVWTLACGSRAEIAHGVKFLEPHGFASVRGLSLLGETSEVVHRVTADHSVGHCASRQFYKSLVAEKARAAFESLVRVAPGAEKSDSRQLNKNLLLSKSAVALSRPELEIHADDVSCAHGSATGELRAEELFYLRSRGVEEKAARLVMTEGFAGEVLEDMPPIPLKEELGELVRVKILELMKS
jgi:Fe-S cluster assembly protein SufD